MMTLDEAIKHAEEVAEEHTKYNRFGGFESCDEYAKEHRQLAEWLKELKQLREQAEWIPCSERLPKPFTYVNATCRSLADNRENWVIETMYLPIPKENNAQGYSDWGNIPMINWGKAEVIAWMERKIPEPYKESEDKE